MAVNSETEMNLKTLQRVDSRIVEIIDNASQVAIYNYETKLNKWEGTDIEGTLFLYKRSVYPYHGFIIVNRMNTTNFVESLSSDMEFLVQEPYFLYKKDCGKIIGSWFYEHEDFRRITNRIQSIVLKQSSPPRRQRCSSDSDSRLKKDEAIQNIMTLLSDAHKVYVENEDSNTILEKNIKEDFNNLATFSEKHINNKSLHVSGKEVKSPCLRSSSEEKTQVSPRRRFLSTGSYDSASSQTYISNKILNMLMSNSNNINTLTTSNDSRSAKCDIFLPSNLNESIKNTSHPRLSPIYSPDDVSSPLKDQRINNLEIDVSLKKKVARNLFVNMGAPSADILPNVEIAKNKKSDFKLHIPDLKKTLVSHIENDSDIVLKIHEAYVASLKSVFTQKKN